MLQDAGFLSPAGECMCRACFYAEQQRTLDARAHAALGQRRRELGTRLWVAAVIGFGILMNVARLDSTVAAYFSGLLGVLGLLLTRSVCGNKLPRGRK